MPLAKSGKENMFLFHKIVDKNIKYYDSFTQFSNLGILSVLQCRLTKYSVFQENSMISQGPATGWRVCYQRGYPV